MDELPPFDKNNHCVKCGNKIEDPVVAPTIPPAKQKAATVPPSGSGGTVPKVMPKREPPNVAYCDGTDCPWFDDPFIEEDDVPEHMHAVCTVCHYEWLTKTLDAT